MKKILAVLAALALLLSTAACSAKESNQGDSQTTVQSAQTTQAQSASVSVKDYGFSSMNPYDETLELSDSQRTILSYCNKNYINVAWADSLARSPKQFRGMKLSLNARVQKILESDDESYTIVCEINSDYNYDAPEDFNRSIVITGPQLEQRFMVDDYASFNGVFEDVKPYTIDGVSYQLATVRVYDSSQISFEGNFEDSLENTAKALFGNDITVRDPKEGIDFEVDDLHGYDYFKIIELNTEDDETAFEIFSGDPRIVKKGSTEKAYTTVKPAADFEHFYFFTENLTAKTGKLEYMTKDFEPVWSIVVEDTDNFVFDYNRSSLMYMLGSDLHIVDVSKGEESISPVYVGERDCISIADDGCAVLTGKGENDNVIKVSADGKILWKVSAPLDVSECESIQVRNDSSVIVGLLDADNYLYVIRIEPDGSFNDPINVYCYPTDDGYYMSGD